MRDMDAQEKLLQKDKDVQAPTTCCSGVAEAEAEWKADPNEAGKLMKYVDALLKTEQPEQENQAIEVLEEAFEKTEQFRFRQKIGMIKLAQLARMERSHARGASRRTRTTPSSRRSSSESPAVRGPRRS